jgi:hypothetical protein
VKHKCSKVEYSVKQKLFIYDTFAQPSSYRKLNRKCNRKHSDSIIPCTALIYNDISIHPEACPKEAVMSSGSSAWDQQNVQLTLVHSC